MDPYTILKHLGSFSVGALSAVIAWEKMLEPLFGSLFMNGKSQDLKVQMATVMADVANLKNSIGTLQTTVGVLQTAITNLPIQIAQLVQSSK